jgi:mono/diheme cytochrome c family protein
MNKWVRRLLYVVSGVAALILIAAAGVYGYTETRLRKHYDLAPTPLVIRTDSQAVARGEHVVRTFGGCVDCHGENLAGKVMISDAAMGTVSSANLTRGKGGFGGVLSDADFVRAIRHGVGPDGRPLKIMPSADYVNLSAEDLAAVIAYLKTLPAVDSDLPTTKLGPVARALFAAGLMPLLHAERIDHAKAIPATVAVGGTLEYGAYLASVGCKGCHGVTLAGGKIADGPPDWPQAANLTPSGPTKDWKEQDFVRLWREGKRPDGSPVNEVMPWKLTKQLSDDELHALYLYLKSIPGLPTGSKPQQTASR